MPFPTIGNTELERARSTLSKIKGPNFDAVKHVRKAFRVGKKENYVGVVKVELSD